MPKSIIAVNKEGKLVIAKELTDVLRSNDYTCIRCKHRVNFFRESKSKRACAYFAHKSGEKTCTHLTFPNEDMKSFKQNKMSDFHISWQKIFPIDNVEVSFSSGDKRRYSDIAFDNMVFEIQHSHIDANIVHERNLFYKSLGKHITWILDITHVPISIDTTVTTKETSHVFHGNLDSWIHNVIRTCFSDGVPVILDNYCTDLFIVLNSITLDAENIKVALVDRNKLLEKYNTSWPVACRKVVDRIQDRIAIDYMFKILRKLPFSKLNDLQDNIGTYLQQEGCPMNEWIKWVIDNRPYKDAKGFGQHVNDTLYSLELKEITRYLRELTTMGNRTRSTLLKVQTFHDETLKHKWNVKFNDANPYTLDYYEMIVN